MSCFYPKVHLTTFQTKKLASYLYFSTKTNASKLVPRKRSSAPPPYVVFFDPFYPFQGSRSEGAGAALGAKHC